MENLKDYRISLKFSEKESDQKDVAKLLKQLGRKKSSFITKAVKYYLENNPSPEIPGSNNIITSMLTENVVKATILKMIHSGELSYNGKINEDDYVEKDTPKPKITKVSTSKNISQQKNTNIEEKSIDLQEIQNNEDVDNLLNMLDEF